MRSTFFTLLFLIPFFSFAQQDYSKAKERALNQSKIEYALLIWEKPEEKTSYNSKSKDINLKKAFNSETGTMKVYLDFGTSSLMSDEKKKMYKRLGSFNNITDILNMLGSFGWNLVYVDEENSSMTYYFKR